MPPVRDRRLPGAARHSAEPNKRLSSPQVMPWRDRQCHHRGAFLTVIGNALDGVEADVLYTTLGFRIFWLKDPGLQADCFRVYNDWLAEFVSYDRKHMAGLPMISLYDPKAGARELERCAKMGLKGAMIWCSPPEDQPYSSDIYDPFWAAAQELKMPAACTRSPAWAGRASTTGASATCVRPCCRTRSRSRSAC